MKKTFLGKLAQYFFAMLVFTCLNAYADEERLEFRIANQPVRSFTLAQLIQQLPAHQIRFFNPLAGKEKSYQAFAIADVLQFAYGAQWQSSSFTDIAFHALDGYESVADLDKFKQQGGYLAFQDLDQPDGWEPIGYRKADPAPFFLVWIKPEQTTDNAFPWPWQIARVNLLRFEDQYPAVIPKGAAKDSAVYRGFTIFHERCLRCHAINQQGGKVGPDLNAPQSITAYRSEAMIKSFIRQPSQYRYTHMPDHSDLSARDLDDLYQYLRFQGKTSQKIPKK